MEERCKNRCGVCGAGIAARHLGSVKIGGADVAIGYCERCNAFAVPIGEDEKPYRERVADARLRVPKGWSMRQCEDGSLELKRGVPCRWLWAFPIGFALLVAMAWAAFAIVTMGMAFICTLMFCVTLAAWLFALYRLTARRYRLDRDMLVVESLWLGFIPVCRFRFVRTAITSGGIEEQGKDFIAVWTNGYDRRVFWRGRSKDEADFIDANLLSLADSRRLAEPLLCGKCGTAFRPGDIDMRRDSLVCQKCGTSTGAGDADYARTVRFRMKYRPHGVIDIPGGFELRERRWWSGALDAAISRFVAVSFIAVSLAGLFEKLPTPWVYIPIAILLLLLAVAPVYFAVSAIVGRFGFHRITAQDGQISYFHGIGKFGWRCELPLDSIGDVGITYRGSHLDKQASIPNALGICIKGERKLRRTFRDCPPIFYHWVEGWLHGRLSV